MIDVYLPADSQKRLLEIAHNALHDCVCGTPRVYEQHDDPYLLEQKYGAFVSLYNGSELRGCVGTCTPHCSLYETVIDVTEAAASRDSRMAPVTPSELEQIHLDITVISPLEKSASPLELKIGKHGLLLARGRRRGLLLPQVASERGWDIETFLAQTCLKAGLREDDWRHSETEISVFTALLIEDDYETA